jgi:hypothetical protein
MPLLENKLNTQDVNLLFDTVLQEMNVRDCAIFEAVYPNANEAHAQLLHFLHHVNECPTKVIEYCQNLLAPKLEE